jgi:hypothetical protein
VELPREGGAGALRRVELPRGVAVALRTPARAASPVAVLSISLGNAPIVRCDREKGEGEPSGSRLSVWGPYYNGPVCRLCVLVVCEGGCCTVRRILKCAIGKKKKMEK